MSLSSVTSTAQSTGGTLQASTLTQVQATTTAFNAAVTSLNSANITKTNLSATTDPGVSNDSTQGYAVGSRWQNVSGARGWICNSATAGAAVWLLSDGLPAPAVSNQANQFGSGTGTFGNSGFLSTQIFSVGSSPGGTGSDYVLATFSVPANSFDQANRQVFLTASGSFAANGHTKEVKIYANPTSATVGSVIGTGGIVIGDTGAYSTSNKAGFILESMVVAESASNTQLAFPTSSCVGATAGGLGPVATSYPVAISGTTSSPILIAVTGNATTTAADIVLNYFSVEAAN